MGADRHESAKKPKSELTQRLDEVERQIANHPAYIEHQVIEGLIRSLQAVFRPNLLVLVHLLERAATDFELAIELVQNVRKPDIQQQFDAELTRALHNYLASALSLVGHVRAVMGKRTDPVAEEFSRRRAEVAGNPLIPFMQDLRNYALHRALPVAGHSFSMTKVNTPEMTFESEVQLFRSELMRGDEFTAVSKAFLREQDERIPLRPLVKAHGELVNGLNAWLIERLQAENEAGLTEVNELIVHHNFLLTGDMESARRVAERRE